MEAYVDKYWRDLNTRNGHELRRLALVIDLFVAWSGTSSSSLSSPPFECMMRSFAAVFQADRDNDPNVLTVLEFRPKGSLLPSNMLRSVRKDARRVKELNKSSAPPPGVAEGVGDHDLAAAGLEVLFALAEEGAFIRFEFPSYSAALTSQWVVC